VDIVIPDDARVVSGPDGATYVTALVVAPKHPYGPTRRDGLAFPDGLKCGPDGYFRAVVKVGRPNYAKIPYVKPAHPHDYQYDYKGGSRTAPDGPESPNT